MDALRLVDAWTETSEQQAPLADRSILHLPARPPDPIVVHSSMMDRIAGILASRRAGMRTLVDQPRCLWPLLNRPAHDSSRRRRIDAGYSVSYIVYTTVRDIRRRDPRVWGPLPFPALGELLQRCIAACLVRPSLYDIIYAEERILPVSTTTARHSPNLPRVKHRLYDRQRWKSSRFDDES
ncbi:hypothetical protein VTO42DRAFT_2403 [Malbranchea cinnamomea]